HRSRTLSLIRSPWSVATTTRLADRVRGSAGVDPRRIRARCYVPGPPRARRGGAPLPLRGARPHLAGLRRLARYPELFLLGMVKPVEIYMGGAPHDPAVPRPVRASRVTFADLAEPMSQNVAGTFFGGALLSFIDRAAAFCAMKHC